MQKKAGAKISIVLKLISPKPNIKTTGISGAEKEKESFTIWEPTA